MVAFFGGSSFTIEPDQDTQNAQDAQGALQQQAHLNHITSVNTRLRSFASFAPDLNLETYITHTFIPAIQWAIAYYTSVLPPNFDASNEDIQAYQNAGNGLNKLLAFISNAAQTNNKSAFQTFSGTVSGNNISALETHVNHWLDNFALSLTTPPPIQP